MFGREVEGREDVPVVLDFGTFGHGVAQTGENLDDLAAHERNRMARSERLGRTRTGHVLDAGGTVRRGVAQLFAQGVDAFGGRGLEPVELLSEFAFELGRHGLELLHEGREFAFFAEDFDAELLQFGRSLRFERLHTPEQIVDFVGHIWDYYAFYLLLWAL